MDVVEVLSGTGKQKDLKTTCHCMSKDLSCGTPERKRGETDHMK